MGTLLGADHRPWLVRVLGHPLEIELAGPLLLLRNDDVPGMVGRVGTLLGDAGVNIANMTLSRTARAADALSRLRPTRWCRRTWYEARGPRGRRGHPPGRLDGWPDGGPPPD